VVLESRGPAAFRAAAGQDSEWPEGAVPKMETKDVATSRKVPSVASAASVASMDSVIERQSEQEAGSDSTRGHPEEQSTSWTQAHPSFGHEATAVEQTKWTEMMDTGIQSYMRQHPSRFHRRVRRGIPQRFRWQVWKEAVRLHDAQLPEDYNALANSVNDWSAAIEIDITRTFPDLRNPSFDGKQQQRLYRVLNAYASHNPDVGYCQGMNFVAGLLLLVSNHEEESFGVLVCLMNHINLAGFYRERLPLFRRYLNACDKLVQETVPELREHFIRENVQPAVYLHQWFLTLFINCFPLSMVMIIWDVIVCEGLPVVLRIAVSILQVLKDSLLAMHFEDIIKFFKMMKTYDDEDGELNAYRIGQLLMKHTENVQIPDRILEYLNREPSEDDANLDADGWEVDDTNAGWFQSITRMFTFGVNRRRRDSLSGTSGQRPANGGESQSGGAAPETLNRAAPLMVSSASGEEMSAAATTIFFLPNR